MSARASWESINWPADFTSARLDVVIPMLNEVHVIERSVTTVRAYLGDGCPCKWRVVIADNGSTDGTTETGSRLASEFDNVSLLRLEQRGRGRALQRAWTESTADIVCYMDVDLSTDLDALPMALAAIVNGGFQIAVGSRLLPESRIRRSPKRELMSRVYNFMVRSLLHTRFSDAQCGFKVLARNAVHGIIPLVENQNWFFDTEVLVLAEQLGYPIADIPVIWDEDNDTRVKFIPTMTEDIRGIFRLRRLIRSGRLTTLRKSSAHRTRLPAGGWQAAQSCHEAQRHP
jgi:glycosyltransferase involved in cell wall biosynthesis